MSTFCGFDLHQVGALEKAVSGTVAPANSLSQAVGRTAERAQSLMAAAAGVSPLNYGCEPSYDTDPNRVGLRAVGAGAGDLAAEVGRRLAHLKGCEKLRHDGFAVNPNEVFDDEAPPDEQKIKDAVAQLLKATSKDNIGDTNDLSDLISQVTGLNRAETEAFVGKLSTDNLAKWNMALGFPHFGGWGVSNDQRLALANSLLSKLGHDQVVRITDTMQTLEPSFGGTDGHGNDDQKGLHWKWQDGKLVISYPSVSDVNQGDLGDCWFLAALGAEVRQNPNFVAQHVHDNGNGTYTVTLYKDGKPVPVTVDGKLPYNGWDGTAFEHPSTGSGNWVALYEKAFAQLKGGYRNTEGGWGSEGMSDLTGKKSDKLPPFVVPLVLIKAKLDSGQPVTVGTSSNHSGFLWLHSDEYVDDNKLVTSHEYTVVSVDAKSDPPTVTLRNPWGPGSSAPEYVTLTESQYQDYCSEVSLGGK